MIQRGRSVAAIGALGLAGALGLTGCSSSSVPNACSLLTSTEISAGAGVSVTKGAIDSDLTNKTQSTCAWRPTVGSFPVIQVFVSAGGSQVAAQRKQADDGYKVASVDVTIAGAHDAYAAGNGTLVGMVVGDYFVQVAYVTNGTGDELAKTTTLAAEAAKAAASH
jgi:hypothetical protein